MAKWPPSSTVCSSKYLSTKIFLQTIFCVLAITEIFHLQQIIYLHDNAAILEFRQTIYRELTPQKYMWCFFCISFSLSIYFIFSVWKSRRGNLRGSAATSSFLAHPPSSNSCRLILAIFCRFLLISADSLNTWNVRHFAVVIWKKRASMKDHMYEFSLNVKCFWPQLLTNTTLSIEMI